MPRMPCCRLAVQMSPDQTLCKKLKPNKDKPQGFAKTPQALLRPSCWQLWSLVNAGHSSLVLTGRPRQVPDHHQMNQNSSLEASSR